MIYAAPCKINLGLNILRRRPDGYHDIETVMVAVPSLCDAVELVPRPEGVVELTTGGLTVDSPPEKNLVVKAYNAVKKHYPTIGGARMHLHKVVPFGAGLGGGSSDAMAVIRALSVCYSLSLSCEEMAAIGATIGSDIPFFACDEPMLCTGRGEIMTPVPTLKEKLSGLCLTIVKPNEGVSTAEAYAGVTPCDSRESLVGILSQPVERWRDMLANDFEASVFDRLPLLARIKESLYQKGALYVSMSGSGSAIFALSRTPLVTDGLFEGMFVHGSVFE